MQASKIEVGELYAVYRNGILSEFKVQSLHTTKTRNNTSSRVKGIFPADEVVTDESGYSARPEYGYGVEDIKGPAEQYKEIMAERAERRAKQEAIEAERMAKFGKLVDLLYSITGLEKPGEDVISYSNHPFRDTGTTLDIREQAIEPLTNAILSLMGKATQPKRAAYYEADDAARAAKETNNV